MQQRRGRPETATRIRSCDRLCPFAPRRGWVYFRDDRCRPAGDVRPVSRRRWAGMHRRHRLQRHKWSDADGALIGIRRPVPLQLHFVLQAPFCSSDFAGHVGHAQDGPQEHVPAADSERSCVSGSLASSFPLPRTCAMAFLALRRRACARVARRRLARALGAFTGRAAGAGPTTCIPSAHTRRRRTWHVAARAPTRRALALRRRRRHWRAQGMGSVPASGAGAHPKCSLV